MTTPIKPPPEWPTWPFTRLTPEQMKKLEREIAARLRREAGEALL